MLCSFVLTFAGCASMQTFVSEQHPGLAGDTGAVTALGTAVAEELGGNVTLGAMAAHFVAVAWDAFVNGPPAATQQTASSSATVTAPAGMKLTPPSASAKSGQPTN